MVAVLSLLALVALGIMFERLWTGPRGLRREARVPAPAPVRARDEAVRAPVPDDSAFQAELDRILRVLETGSGPDRPILRAAAAAPIRLDDTMRMDAGAAGGASRDAGTAPPDPTVSQILTTLSAIPVELPLFEDFDSSRDVLVIEADNADAKISLRIEGADAETILMVDGIDRARVKPANGTFDAAAVRLVAA